MSRSTLRYVMISISLGPMCQGIGDRVSGEAALICGDAVERLLQVELGYVGWCIREDGAFENGKYVVRKRDTG
jgi:hypothetical protein